jgi:hypothetical protein
LFGAIERIVDLDPFGFVDTAMKCPGPTNITSVKELTRVNRFGVALIRLYLCITSMDYPVARFKTVF